MREDACFSLRDLAVNGNDLLQAGVAPGKPVGAALAGLLDAVIDGKAENTQSRRCWHISRPCRRRPKARHSMLTEERYQYILEYLQEHGSVTLSRS